MMDSEIRRDADVDDDLDRDDALLNVPLRSLDSAALLRGVALVLVACMILLWPDRSDKVLGVLIGIALAVYAVGMSIDLVRDPDRRTFWSFLAVAASGGFAAALITSPADSLTSVAQGTGAIAIAMALLEIVRMIRARAATSWGISKSTALVIGGALLIAYPGALLAAVTSIAAGLLAAAGFIEVFSGADKGSRGAGVTGQRIATSVTAWIRRRPDMAEDLASLQEKVFFEGPTSATRYARFATLMVLSAVIASFGVVVESTAVVIGAMLVAPLMTPLMGTALSASMGWPRRLLRCAGIAMSGVVIAIATGALVGAIVPRTIDVTTNTEILARVSPTIVDLAIAVAAGAAGAYALSRRDVSDALPGVAVAISLVPPLTVVGLTWQQGAFLEGNGALLLFLTNASAILVAGGGTFVLVGAVPYRRISESQERITTLAVGMLAFAALIALLLLMNGSDVARSELSRAGVEQVLDDWTDEHTEFGVLEDRTLSDGTIVIDLAGPGEPPALERLLDDLSEAAGTGVPVTVRWVDRQEVTSSG